MEKDNNLSMQIEKSKDIKITPSSRKEIIKIVDDRIKETHVTKEDFSELKAIFRELAEVQKRTEGGLNQLTNRINQLAEAQNKLTTSVVQLAEGLNQLTIRVDQLAEGLNQLTIRVDQLTTRVDQLTTRVDQLAEAQRRTEEELRQLIKEHERTREILSGISDTVGYGLEDKIFPYMHEFVEKEYGVKAEVIDRRNIVYSDGRYDEVNIYVEGFRDGERVLVVGECKSRPTVKEVEDFWGMVNRLRDHLKLKVYPFIVGYTYSPSVEAYLRDRYPEIKMLKSFEFELKYKAITSKVDRKNNLQS